MSGPRSSGPKLHLRLYWCRLKQRAMFASVARLGYDIRAGEGSSRSIFQVFRRLVIYHLTLPLPHPIPVFAELERLEDTVLQELMGLGAGLGHLLQYLSLRRFVLELTKR